MRLILASRNQGKIKELVSLLSPLDLEVVSLSLYPELPEIIEDGTTFVENAVKKAKTIALATGCLAMGDDSGLEVDCLNGAPGIFSARFAGEKSDDLANNMKLLKLLENVPWEERKARFICVVAIATPSGRIFTAEGSCQGLIAFEQKGAGGFGYDPLFYVPGFDKTFAELEPDVKKTISHRARALTGAYKILQEIIQNKLI
ncbi:MAG: Non-canonical purine NTP pyrophosphatase [Desulfotomaculum sp. 46_296]|nr:MAG: Non-canonical purine NTP pyrophosphatase [Desulfotomaculum sp. 46_296]HAU31066.1 non-canonical purine NTP pyrophosphatase [Desulfotomaculum sp.]